MLDHPCFLWFSYDFPIFRWVFLWFSLAPQASELKNATKDAMQQTKEAFAAEAKMVAKDMADLKAGDG